MKAFFQKLEPGPERSFMTHRYTIPYFNVAWHFHPEIELTYIVRSSGTRYVGDSIRLFEPGDLVLLGPNLPHCWENHSPLNEEKDHVAEAVVIQFDRKFMGAEFFRIPEMMAINELLDRSAQGLYFHGLTAEQIGPRVLDLESRTPVQQLSELLLILQTLAESTEYDLLSSRGFVAQLAHTESEKINLVFDYLRENFKTRISLDEVAALTHMTPSAFCRFFKTRTNKTFIQYVNEFRIGYASRLLIESDLTVSQIAGESGFHNMANFNRLFRRIRNTSPLRFRKQFRLTG